MELLPLLQVKMVKVSMRAKSLSNLFVLLTGMSKLRL